VATFGEHTIGAAPSAPTGRYPTSVSGTDAHADLRDEYQGSRYNHACSIRRMLDASGHRLAAIRTPRKLSTSATTGCLYFPAPAPDFSALSTPDDHVYVTIDLDGIDCARRPRLARRSWRLSWDEVSAVPRPSPQRRIVGFTYRVCPIQGPGVRLSAAKPPTARLARLGPPDGQVHRNQRRGRYLNRGCPP
jgi:agmatinase